MGGSQSVAAVSREQVLRASEPMRLIADAALQVMLERITPKDLLDMANPATCKNYILVIGGAFEQYFRSIDVMPVVRGTKNPKTIYFQRADVLTSSTPTKNPEIDKIIAAQRQEICVALGYFFTRFFQIFAALSLSIFDSAGIRQVSTFMGQYQGLVGGPTAALGGPVFAGPGAVVASGGGTQTFSFMRQYLEPGRLITLGYMNFYQLKARPGIYFSIKKTASEQSSGTAFVAYEISRGEFGSVPTYLIARINIRENRIIVDKVYLWKKSKTAMAAQTTYEQTSAFENIYIELDDTMRVVYPIQGSKDVIQQALSLLIRHIGKTIKSLDANPTSYVYPEISTTATTDYRRTDTRDIYGRATGEQRRASEVVPTSIRPIYDAVKSSYKPVAHCIARSLQLLQLDAVSGRAAPTFICNYKFISPNPSGLPRPGEAVTTSPGLASLGTLYNLFVNGTPQLTDDSRREYLELLQRLERIFASPSSISTSAPKMGDIRDKWELAMCKEIAGQRGIKDPMTQPLTVAPAQIQIARDGVKILWKRQLDHVREVDKLFALMFTIGKDRKININPRILEGGIPGLDGIAVLARRLLANYYVDCETSYKETVGKIVGRPGIVTVAPVVAAAATGAGPKEIRVIAPAAQRQVVAQQEGQFLAQRR